jgi:hypothetical protein
MVPAVNRNPKNRNRNFIDQIFRGEYVARSECAACHLGRPVYRSHHGPAIQHRRIKARQASNLCHRARLGRAAKSAPPGSSDAPQDCIAPAFRPSIRRALGGRHAGHHSLRLRGEPLAKEKRGPDRVLALPGCRSRCRVVRNQWTVPAGRQDQWFVNHNYRKLLSYTRLARAGLHGTARI